MEENGEDDEEEEDGEESQRLEFPDDVANIKAFEEARSRQGRFLGVSPTTTERGADVGRLLRKRD